MTVAELIRENKRRRNYAPYDPYSGEGAPLERRWLVVEDFYLPAQYIPTAMFDDPLVIGLSKAGSISKYLKMIGEEVTEETAAAVKNILIQVRGKHDFFYWAASFGSIKNKEGGPNVSFILNRPQRRLAAKYESQRLKGVPIRLILLKARQWGGSTVTQIYMAWIQLMHMEGWYSAIVAQDNSSALRIKAMYSKLLKEYPPEMLGLSPDAGALEFGSYGGSQNDSIIKAGGNVVRDTVVSIGSVVSPNSIRSGDIAMMHASEVGVWKETEEWNAAKIIRSVSGSILDRPMTMIVYESTANGTGNFFHTEWLRAKKQEGDPDKSQMTAFFVPWFEIELYERQFESKGEKEKFARWLIKNKDNKTPDVHPDPGVYYWGLWERGATLENIYWYVGERRNYGSHADMASEFPSDDIEAFTHSGSKVFDPYRLDRLRAGCSNPEFIGDVIGSAQFGPGVFDNLRFVESERGELSVWEMPETGIKNRYIVIVDPQRGISEAADFSCITVIDRYWMQFGGYESIAAEWHGHIDMDLLAWKAAQIATMYDNALLVIERNTFDSVKGKAMDEGEFIIDTIAREYSNMYIYRPMGKVIDKDAVSYGWFTNGGTKPTIIHNFISIVREQSYTERSVSAIDEMSVYEKKENGNWGAMKGHHDEKVITRAIGLFISRSQMDMPAKAPDLKVRVKTVRVVTQ